MKVVILAGGRGTRLSEETQVKPKPLVEVGDRPILWHIMAYYASFGHTEFIICAGYRGYMIKEYFANYLLHNADVTFDLATQAVHVERSRAENWRVTVVDTGDATMTGGRILRIRDYVRDGTFLFTYGDGLANVDLDALVAFHRQRAKALTVTAVKPIGRFGALQLQEDGTVASFVEKPAGDGGWINGGYFVAEPALFDYIAGDTTVLEQDPFQGLVRDEAVAAFAHDGFWHPMDTLRDRDYLREVWHQGQAPWAVDAAAVAGRGRGS